MSGMEIAANVFSAGSVVLAGLNRVHTWWVGIVACMLFGWVFYEANLYADVTLQLFYIVTNAIGWWSWLRGGGQGDALPVRRTQPAALAGMLAGGVAVTGAYGWLLHRFTDAYAPFVDSAVMAFSVVAQLLLMRRRYETWWFWLLVNTICVPLYLSRGLGLTAVLFAAFWVNAAVALVRWRRLVQPAA
ncbi:nicotinamide riboside transporter PnuC [Longimicrobium sp.]|uniref:nicotinamide riboside transporter PnuC n=1 Tax=Longimicrobium sp. TaxID=2029185 RepID=UPI003B3AEC9C